MLRLRSLLMWLKPLHWLRGGSHNVSVPEPVELPIDIPEVPASQTDEREHLESVISENDKRLAALRAQVNAQLRR
jgi:hypothetical protein